MVPTVVRSPRSVAAVAAAVATVAFVVGFELARPLGAASIAFDSQVAVLHFERLAAGLRLEAFLPTTPKPLLTVLFGGLYALTGDWRALALATLAAYVVVVALTVVLARRLGGPIAGVFSGVAVAVAPSILFDVGFALATPLAAIGWLSAGLAVTGRSPRYGLAGLALGLATLARLETAVVTGFVTAALVLLAFAPRSLVGGASRPPSRAWLVPAVALLAFPVMMLHDWLLTGDPTFWLSVSRLYTDLTRLPVPTASEVIGLIAERYLGLGALVLLALLGGVALARGRSWAILLGLLGLVPGIAAFLVLLAFRGIFVSDRYLAAVDLGVAFAAGIGAAALARSLALAGGPLAGLAPASPAPRWAAGRLILAGAVALLVAGPYWIVDPALREQVARSRRLAADTDRAAAVIDPELERMRAAGASLDQIAGAIVLGPGPVVPRLVVELEVAVPAVEMTRGVDVDVAAGYPSAGQIVFHSVAGDVPPRWDELQNDAPVIIGNVRVMPLLADPGRGLWVQRLEEASR